MTAELGLIIGLALIVFFLGLLVVGLLRSHAEILRQLDSLGAGLDDRERPSEHRLALTNRDRRGSPASIVGVNPDGEPVAISPAAGKEPTLIAFLSTSCSSCTVFWEGLDRAQMHFGDQKHRVVLVTLGPEEESPTRAQALARTEADVVMSSEAWEAFEVPGAPFFVLTEPGSGVIGEGSADNFEALMTFLGDSTRDRRWDRRVTAVEPADQPDRIDRELRDSGIEPGDPRLHHRPGDVDGR